MAVHLDQFSALTSGRNLRDTDVLTVTDREQLKLRGSRLPIVRWLLNSGIGKRARNRRTVDSFLRAMENQFGHELVKKMEFESLRDLQRRGKPLNLRQVRSSVDEALRLQRDASTVAEQVEREISESAWSSMPGGAELARDVRDGMDFHTLFRDLQEQVESYRGGEPLWQVAPHLVERLAASACGKSFRNVFLGGYGVQRGSTDTTRLQQLIDTLPESKQLLAEYGVAADAGKMPPAFFEQLGMKLERKLGEAMQRPQRLAAGNAQEPVKARLQQLVQETAQQLTRQHLQGRLEALAALRQTLAQDPAAAGGDHNGLSEQLLRSRVPASQVPRLVALRREMPKDLGMLGAPGHELTDKFRLLHAFGALVVRTITDMSPEQQAEYAPGPESLYFMEDCANFLKQGHLGDTDLEQVRQALTAGPASDLVGLYQSLQDMKYAAECNCTDGSLKTDPVWGEAYRAIEQVDAAFKQFPGYMEMLEQVDVSEDRQYSREALPAYQAMRDAGINVPAPQEDG